MAGSSNDRAWEIDALRGLMLVLMTATHLPTRFAGPLGQPFGYVSAAEGFVLLSGFMAGLVYTRRRQKHGEREMRTAFVKRAAKLYLWQIALLLLLCSVIAFIGAARQQDAIVNLLSYYWEEPLRAFVGGLVLLYNPPLLDILPMYVLFLLFSAPLLLHGLRGGWSSILAGSVALWLAAQAGLAEWTYEWLAGATGVAAPPAAHTGSFSIAAWQLLWVMGLWMGSTSVATAPGEPRATPARFPTWMVNGALLVALVGLAWRHGVGQAPFGADAALNALFDKWTLGPLRLVNLFALMVILIHYAPLFRRHVPKLGVLQTLGGASLPVFIAHLLIALGALTWFGTARPDRPLLLDVGLFVGTFVLLYAVAWTSAQTERRSEAARRRAAAWAQGRRALISRRHSA